MEERIMLMFVILMIIVLKESTSSSMSMVVNTSSVNLKEISAFKGVCQESERDALNKFYNIMLNKEDFSHIHKGITNCCLWKGVNCNAHGSIVSLMLNFGILQTIENASLLWPIPLGQLQSLQTLEMVGVQLEGPLPPTVGLLPQSLVSLAIRNCDVWDPVLWMALANLSRLSHLDLSQNFDISVDEQVCNLTNLIHLDLHGNKLLHLPACVGFQLPCLSYLDLSSNGLSGRIPPFQLPHLSHLDLSYNYGLSGDPTFCNSSVSLTFLDLRSNLLQSLGRLGCISNGEGCNFTHLQHLDLANNNLTGRLPACLGLLPRLSYLDISHNRFFGQIPASWNWSSSQLTHLDLSDNKLDGPIRPALLGPNLQVLSLYQNKLTGSIPESLASLSPKLLELDLTDNQISGTLEEIQWEKLSHLNRMDLSGNQISGTISLRIQWDKLLNLTWLDLSSNQLSGTLPASLRLITPTLEHLDLSYNNMTGSLPSWIITTSAATSWSFHRDLSFNGFISLCNASSSSGVIKTLDISHNLLQGSIVPWLNFSVFDSLDLSHNLLHGTIPPSWFIKFVKEASIDLSFNSLSGALSLASLCSSHTGMYYFAASNNNFSRILDTHIKACKLSSLDLHSNNLRGVVPWHALFGNGMYHVGSETYNSAIFALNLADNRLSGEFLERLAKWSKKEASLIQQLDLSHNYLSGAVFTPYFDSWPNLQSLDLSSNFFSGGVPSNICQQSLGSIVAVLRLAENNLAGSIPDELGQCTGLQTLVLHSNRLTGSIPAGIRNLSSSLEVLNLAHNQLEGPIPMWLQNMSTIRVLLLDYNDLSGPLPASPWNTSQLQVLGLSHNHLTGVLSAESLSLLQGFDYNLPSNLQDNTLYEESTIHGKGEDLNFAYILQATVSLDLSFNDLHGPIPPQLASLTGLVFLDLSHNHLNGTVPQSVGSLTQLQSLDLSCNDLEGKIPDDLCKLDFLQFANFSENQLKGRIPGCPHWCSTFDSSSFLGNKDLQGSPADDQCAVPPQYAPRTNTSAVPATEVQPGAAVNEFVLAVVVGVCFSFPFTLLLTMFWRPMSQFAHIMAQQLLDKLCMHRHYNNIG